MREGEKKRKVQGDEKDDVGPLNQGGVGEEKEKAIVTRDNMFSSDDDVEEEEDEDENEDALQSIRDMHLCNKIRDIKFDVAWLRACKYSHNLYVVFTDGLLLSLSLSQYILIKIQFERLFIKRTELYFKSLLANKPYFV